MKRIMLGHSNVYATVDDEDAKAVVEAGPWFVSRNGNKRLQGAQRRIRKPDGSRKVQFLHRYLLNPPSDVSIDHIDGNPLNNCRSNLRFATKSQNACNRGMQSDNTSGYKGVTWKKQNKQWQAKIKVQGRTIFLGYFTNKQVAARAYDEAARYYHGQFARVNSALSIVESL